MSRFAGYVDLGIEAALEVQYVITWTNVEHLRDMGLSQNLTPAVLPHEGIRHCYMASGVMTARQLDYLRECLRILLGFYGLLQRFDGLMPYQVEAKLIVGIAAVNWAWLKALPSAQGRISLA